MLAVDDNAANLKLIAAMLKEMVTEVVVCKNGKEAVNLAQSQPFDIIFMDIQMPVMDGLSATRALRALPRFEALPIIAMTANAMASDREACLAAGMNDHVGKPFEIDHLVRTLLHFTGRPAL